MNLKKLEGKRIIWRDVEMQIKSIQQEGANVRARCIVGTGEERTKIVIEAPSLRMFEVARSEWLRREANRICHASLKGNQQ